MPTFIGVPIGRGERVATEIDVIYFRHRRPVPRKRKLYAITDGPADPEIVSAETVRECGETGIRSSG